MDVLRKFYETQGPLVILAGLVVGICILINLHLWRNRRRVVEHFQDNADTADKELKQELESTSSEIAKEKSPPMFQQENCMMIKKAIDAFRITEISKKPEAQQMAKSNVFKSQKAMMEEKFNALSCKEYMERVASGEIPPPQTQLDMKPDILPSML